MRTPILVLVTSVLILSFALSALADSPGQKDLDEATDLQLTAETNADLEKIIALGESALTKGLEPKQEEFAKKMLAATLSGHAERICKAVFDQVPPSRDWQLIRQSALKDLERAKTHDPRLPDPYLLSAKLLALPGGDLQAAKASLAEAIKLLKDEPKQLAQVYLLRGQLAEDVADKLQDLDRAAKADPDNLDVLKLRAAIHLAKSDSAAAVVDLEKLTEKDPANLDVLGMLADVLISLKKFDEALERAGKLIEKAPNSSLGYDLRARIKLIKDDAQGSLADLDQALKLNPSDVMALLLRGQVHASLGQEAKAKDDVEQALRLRPDLPRAILLRSALLAQMKKFGEAINDIKTLLLDDPQNQEYRLQLAQYYAADKRPRKAIEILTSIIEDNEKNSDALRARADALLSIGKHAEAIGDYEKSLALAPQDVGALNNLAWVLATSEDEKIRVGKRSIELATKACDLTKYLKAHIVSTLASGYAETGDFETAIKWSTKAVELGGDPEIKEQLRKELESYQQKKPWRETQVIEENTAPLEPKKKELDT